MEELRAKHRKEQRELQGKITNKKKNATKKTRKGVNDECERLERELREQQQAEIDALEPRSVDERAAEASDLPVDEVQEDGDGEVAPQASGILPPLTTKIDSHLDSESEATSQHQQGRPKKASRQKARLARRAAEQEEAAAAAELEAANMPDLREQEMAAMKKQLEKLNLSETLIRPDGHCLFSACAHSMPPDMLATDRPQGELYKNVRGAAASYMLEHPDDFEAFLEEPLMSYAAKIRDTAEWGGQLELQAIARTFNIDINVLQADGRVENIVSGSDNQAKEPIWLAYYRHSFGLGEHYNALKKKAAP